MSKTGLDWYKREPQAYLGGVQGMTAREHAVYAVTLDLIYANGGAINNDPKWIAGWISDMGQAAVRKTIEILIARGKLLIDGEFLTQKRAKNEAKTKEKLRENAEKNGKKGGEKSAELRAKPRKNNALAEPPASRKIQADKRKEEKEKEEPNGSSQKEASPKKRKSRLSEDWRLPREWGLWAVQQGMDEPTARREADQFKDHHIGHGNTMLDWKRAWQTWVRNHFKFKPSKSKPAVQMTTDEYLDQVL